MKLPGWNVMGAVLLVVAGYACGSGGAGKMVDAITDAITLYELNGGSLAGQLAEAGPPTITAGFGIAERVPEDGTRHFTLTASGVQWAAFGHSGRGSCRSCGRFARGGFRRATRPQAPWKPHSGFHSSHSLHPPSSDLDSSIRLRRGRARRSPRPDRSVCRPRSVASR